ncbi:MAG: hypothetical protein QXT13_07935 [Pyrobaculum sp.]
MGHREDMVMSKISKASAVAILLATGALAGGIYPYSYFAILPVLIAATYTIARIVHIELSWAAVYAGIVGFVYELTYENVYRLLHIAFGVSIGSTGWELGVFWLSASWILVSLVVAALYNLRVEAQSQQEKRKKKEKKKKEEDRVCF